MPKRGGLSLSIKMIVTTTLLVVVTVVGSGMLNIVNVRHAFDATADNQIKQFRQSRQVLGEAGTPLLASAVQQALVDRGQDAELFELVRRTVAQDTKDVGGQKDYGLRFALVADLNQNVIVQCHEGGDASADVKCSPDAPGSHVPISPALGALTVDSWAQAIAAWKAAAANPNTRGDALITFELTSGTEHYQMFARPVFVGEPATAAGALAPEPPAARQGYVMLGYDLAPTDWFAATAAIQRAAASRRAALYTGVVGALFVLIGTVLAILQGLSISKPLKLLSWKAGQIARGDLDARVDITSGDEIGALGESFNFMADQIEVLLVQTAEKARIEQELEVARAIQETLVPGSELVDRGTLTFAGYFQPAAQTGGDWWTWHEMVDGKILLVVGDVTGHGVPSAMITAAAKAACDVARNVHNDDVTVSRLLEIMNYAIFESAKRKFVMTCFASIVDTKARTITYANAGHNFPYLFRAGPSADGGKGEFGSLMIRGNRLGDDASSKYEAKTTELLPGDVLVWYTDGIVECENAEGSEYGEKRFRASVKRAAALDAAEMRDAIVAEATAYFGKTARKDDITMVIGRIH